MSRNTCVTIEEIFPDYMDLLYSQVLIGFFYTLIFILACIGNGTVLYGLVFRSLELNVRNVFVWSLALADMFVCATSLPITAYHNHTRQWHFGSFMCKLVPLLQGSGIFITSFTLMAIAYDRYRLLCHPFEAKFSLRSALLLVGFMWVFGCCAATPYALSMETEVNYTVLETVSNTSIQICGEFCEEVWQSDTSRNVYGVSVFLLQYVVPLLFCSVCYMKIALKLKHNNRSRMLNETSSLKTKRSLNRRKRKVNNMIGLMLFSFIGAWLPFNILHLFRDFSISDTDDVWYPTVFVACHLLAMTSLIWNPVSNHYREVSMFHQTHLFSKHVITLQIIYCFCNDQFRAMLNPSKCSNGDVRLETRNYPTSMI